MTDHNHKHSQNHIHGHHHSVSGRIGVAFFLNFFFTIIEFEQPEEPCRDGDML